MNTSTTRCPMCGGRLDHGTMLFSVDLCAGVVVVRDVPAVICSPCGGAIIKDEVAARLEAIVERAREDHVDIAVIRWPDAAASILIAAGRRSSIVRFFECLDDHETLVQASQEGITRRREG